ASGGICRVAHRLLRRLHDHGRYRRLSHRPHHRTRVWRPGQPHRLPCALFSVLVGVLGACGVDDGAQARRTGGYQIGLIAGKESRLRRGRGRRFDDSRRYGVPDGSAQNNATGLAGGLIVIALLETLLDKNVIALAEARHILQRAVNSLSPARTTEEREALKVLAGMQRGYFSERS